MKFPHFLLLFAVIFLLAACGISKQANSPVPISTSTASVPAQTSAASPRWDESTKTDSQGAVIIEITPLNLNGPGETLEFEVAMNTHSVDLSMDLAALATLSTDTGRSVPALAWNAPRGGHHVSGTLVFPAVYEGQPVLQGATQITLSIKDVDAALRVFTWTLSR